MNNKKLATALSAAIVMAISNSASALSLAEVEVNQPLGNAQRLTVTSASDIAIDAVLGTLGATVTTSRTRTATTVPGDLDFYEFTAREGDVITIDVDGAWGGQQRIDSVIAIFDANGTMLRMNDDAWPIDAGSSSSLDSRVDNFVVPASGRYVVGVSSYPRYFKDGGVTYDGMAANGDYSLVLSGISPAVLNINIDVKPGSNDRAPINPKSNGKVPVALLTSDEFDATTVDTTSVTFGATGDESTATQCQTKDVNHDGRLDMLCHFPMGGAGFTYESIEGVVMGTTTDGTAFEGRGLLKVVPALTK